MTDCNKFENKLTLYFEGELTTEERKEIHRHLEGCADCQNRIETWRLVQNQIRKLPAVTTSSAFESKLHARIREINQGEIRIVFWEKWRLPAYLALGAAALVIFILLTPGELQTPQIQVSQQKAATFPNVTKSNPGTVKSPPMSREKLLRSLQASRGISLDSSAQKLLEDSLREEYNRQIKTVKGQE